MKQLIGLIATASLAFSGTALAQGKSIHEATFEVTITNLTRGQSFTPMIVTAHTQNVSLFELGAEPSQALADLAEGGDTSGVAMALEDSGAASDIQFTDGGLIAPGESRTVVIETSLRGYNRLSLAGMLLPTNDTFVALNALPLDFWGQASTYVFAYDAGSENNDEACASIPGPHCGGQPFSMGLGEGYVHISPGIAGIGDLDPAEFDWRNPVAVVNVTRIR